MKTCSSIDESLVIWYWLWIIEYKWWGNEAAVMMESGICKNEHRAP